MVEAKNQAESMIRSTEKSIIDLGDKVSEEDKDAAEKAVVLLKEALEADNADDIKSRTEELAQAAMKIGEAAYNAEQAEAEGDAAADAAEDDDVVDAEFEEVDDKK
ncbi:MAG: Hsp70 family protein [Rhizobiaceae bacterium]|nr:Hsp70 family protein [Rhizobiaceae bacterium]